MAKRATQGLLLLSFVLLVGCDHATKLEAKNALEGRAPIELVSSIVDLRYAENHDTAFSLSSAAHFAGKDAIILSVALLATLLVAASAWRRRHGASALELAGYAFVGAGAIGNVADRLLRGYVIDFIHVAHWPVFSVADVAIVAGAAMLALTKLRTPNAA